MPTPTPVAADTLTATLERLGPPVFGLALLLLVGAWWFGGRIVHGLYTASLISAVLGTRLPGPGAVYRSQTLNFHAPVKIGDVVNVVVEVRELISAGRRVRLGCEALVDATLVLDGEAVVSVPPSPTPTAPQPP